MHVPIHKYPTIRPLHANGLRLFKNDVTHPNYIFHHVNIHLLVSISSIRMNIDHFLNNRNLLVVQFFCQWIGWLKKFHRHSKSILIFGHKCFGHCPKISTVQSTMVWSPTLIQWLKTFWSLLEKFSC